MNDEILNSLSDGTFRARWLREVFRASQITESVKVLLISMGVEEMDPAGRVSVPRVDLARRIGRAPARVSERISEAVEMGFLVRLSAGKKSHTAVYAAAIKGSACPDLIDGAPDPGKGPANRTESEGVGSGYLDPSQHENGADSRTRTSFGSDLQDALKGPASRTETMFGSDLQDALEGDEVRIAGPNGSIKGPAIRDAKVEGVKGEELPTPSEDEEDFLLNEEEDAPPAKKTRKTRAKADKIPIPQDFAPDEAMIAWAREKCPLVDIEYQTVAFIEHFTAEPGEKPEVRPGWNRSWKRWMLRQQGWARERQSNVRQLRPTGTSGYQPYRNPKDQSVYHESF